MFDMVIAPAGGRGAFPLLPEVLVGVGVAELPEELDDPAEPEEPVNWFVVVPDEEDVIAFDPPQPVTEKIARMSAPIAQNPFRFNSILDLSVGGGPTVRSS